ncbi:MAG: hypothetical protein K0U86_09730 [Planctomycetes bacterium]|nr:hypothetical protein [Planctomycetota bacterium]MCH9725170.1 hypothetical protein [Planctomycetota bacterium]MCH9775373.1 hypothetical protein [Planctomycetota bacterium]MCH9793070.1 hypothetical protein [Planctomycetota bacterium]
MRKTGIIFFLLMGVCVLFLLKTRNTEQSVAQEKRNTLELKNPNIQQIPARIAQNVNSITSQNTDITSNELIPKQSSQKSESAGSFEGFSTEEILDKLVGKWEQTKSTRKQILTIKENGTATMVIEPQGIWKAMLGNQVTINIKWSLNAAKLTLRTVGGSPENKLEYINQVWGNEFVREIHSIEDKMFTLRDNEGDVSQKWIRTSY